MKIDLRNANINDLDSIYSLICELEGYQFDKDDFQKTFMNNLENPNIRYIVAVTNEVIIGLISLHIQNLLHHSKRTGEIQELIVSNSYRNFGVGKKLMEEIEKIACENNLEEIELTTKICRKQAHGFYTHLGYQNTHYKFVKSTKRQ